MMQPAAVWVFQKGMRTGGGVRRSAGKWKTHEACGGDMFVFAVLPACLKTGFSHSARKAC
jgi:hypothetical protein